MDRKKKVPVFASTYISSILLETWNYGFFPLNFTAIKPDKVDGSILIL